MSSDTSIAIAKFTDGRRHTGVIQAIENMDRKWFKSDEEWKQYIQEYDWSVVFNTKQKCHCNAFFIENRYVENNGLGVGLEHGIVYIGEFPFSINQPINEPTTLGTN